MADRPLLGDSINDPSKDTNAAKAAFGAPLLFSIIAGIAPLLFGYTLGFTSPIKAELEKPPHEGLSLDDNQFSFFGSLVNIGAIAGALLGGLLCEKIGRKLSITFCTIPYCVGYILIYIAKSYAVLLVGRVLTGVGVGVASLSTPVYISEIAPAEYRGGLGTINQLGVTVGILICYAIGVALKWRTMALIGAAMAGVLFVLSFILPKTPTYCMGRTDAKGALKSLKRLRGPDYPCTTELAEIEQNLAIASAQSDASFKDLFRGAGGRAMVVGVGLMIFQQFSGINTVIFYSGQIFSDAGFKDSNVASLIVGVVQMVVTGVACLIIDRTGRRSLLMVAGIGMTASLGSLGYYFYLQNQGFTVDNPLALVAVILYVAFFSLGLGAIPWLMMSEIFPANIRGMASSFATLLNWTFSFLVTKTFTDMTTTLSIEGVFWFYGAVCIGGVFFVFKVPPETKGRTLEQIEAYFSGRDMSAGAGGEGIGLVQLVSLLSALYLGLSIILITL